MFGFVFIMDAAKIAKFKQSNLFQTLNDPYTDCKTNNNICTGALRQKVLPNSIGSNLRHVKPYKVVELRVETVFIKHRSALYLSSYTHLIVYIDKHFSY